MDNSNNPSVKILKPSFPQWQEYTIVPILEKEESNPPTGSQDTYEVKLWLTRYNRICIPDNFNIDNPQPEPDSYIHIKIDTNNPKTSIAKLRVSIDQKMQALLEPNKDGRLSQIIINIRAKDFRNAIDKSYTSIMPFLSHLSFLTNTPLLINAIKAKMESTHSQRIFCLMEGQNKPFPYELNLSQVFFNNPTHLGLLSIYREALNIPISPFYQVFLLHRIREGIYKYLRIRKGITDGIGEEILDKSAEIHNDFLEMRFSEIHKKIKNKFRNDFAHFNLTKSGLLKQSPDRFNNFFDCVTKWLPISFLITKKMLESELKGVHRRRIM